MDLSAKSLADEQLRCAKSFVEAADAGDAMRCARRAEQISIEGGYKEGEAEARLYVAEVHFRLTGEFREALESARQAAAKFQAAGLASGECRALSMQAIAASRLAYCETAIDAALLAVLLSRNPSLGTAPRDGVGAYQALALAMFAGRAYDDAAIAMQQSIERAQDVYSAAELHELHADLASTEVIRYFTSREVGEHLHSLQPLEMHLEKCEELAVKAGGLGAQKHISAGLIHLLSRANLLSWQGKSTQAQELIDAMQEAIQSPRRPWMEAAVNWCRSELALSQSELGMARMHCEGMVSVAMTYQHGTLLNLGLRLKAHLAGLAGDHASAAQALRTLSAREQKARAEGLRLRLADVERQMELRQRNEELRKAREDQQRLHDLANADPLTSLPNRRRFESFMEHLLEDCRRSGEGEHCLIYVDVDRFKAINDLHSHAVGDLVLKGVGQTLRGCARERDLPVRIAGDEFALVLLDMDLQEAQGFCQRLRGAVETYPWENIAAGLKVSVSLGVSVIDPKHSLADLLAKSDVAMYADKARQREAS